MFTNLNNRQISKGQVTSTAVG